METPTSLHNKSFQGGFDVMLSPCDIWCPRPPLPPPKKKNSKQWLKFNFSLRWNKPKEDVFKQSVAETVTKHCSPNGKLYIEQVTMHETARVVFSIIIRAVFRSIYPSVFYDLSYWLFQTGLKDGLTERQVEGLTEWMTNLTDRGTHGRTVWLTD